jgi:hypothetical protein
MTCSDLWDIHQRKCKNRKRGFSNRLGSDEITTRGYMALPLQSVQLS